MKELNVNVENGVKTLEISEGSALPKKEPLKVEIRGLINAPLNYLTKRVEEIDQLKCYLIVDKSEGYLKLVIDEKNHYRDAVRGDLIVNPDYKKFEINTGEGRNTFALADFIKMNRFFFEDKNVAMKLVSELKNFEATVNKQIELSDNDRGNKRILQNQIVDSNIPEAFEINLPLFKGQPAEKIKVEINIDARDFSCILISPDANDLMQEVRETILDEQLDVIKELAPNLVIFEV